VPKIGIVLYNINHMNKSTKIIGIIIVVVIVAALVIFLTNNKQMIAKPAQTPTTDNTTISPTPLVESPSQIKVSHTPTSTITPKTEVNSTQYTDEFRAQVRNTFIANCKAKLGQQYASNCACGADYLTAHYTDAELTKIYLEYHSSSQIPKEVQAAYNACK
jgi:hypothetical protein